MGTVQIGCMQRDLVFFILLFANAGNPCFRSLNKETSQKLFFLLHEQHLRVYDAFEASRHSSHISICYPKL